LGSKINFSKMNVVQDGATVVVDRRDAEVTEGRTESREATLRREEEW
jgi:hypothetical protein